ncbi:HNH endonuclease [Corynebacterium sp. p3-SID1194]|uniref:HNH endonuclease signature motif containing protein n=1 Tax=Corynebacterium sp. p3-SID1194 TaxID=2916105 RepID=UPI0021A776BA|nr:HNH endonuclease [Corynebacterium sp. p3-SID1194]MCT1450635.1 HNH endonuclease [Corynebacterium sp. p3-SID1194]
MTTDLWRTGEAVQLRKRYRQQCENTHAPCWLCGQPIDYQAAALHPNSFEVDHYLPRRDYPHLALEETNLRPAHSSCNRSRGARDDILQIGPTTTTW